MFPAHSGARYLRETYFAPMLGLMDWQQTTALLIVGVTALLFILSKWRRKKSVLHETHCGCNSGPQIGPKQTIQFRARKGERPQVIIKNQPSNSLL